MRPAVSLIMAIDNFGVVYASMTNVNTDNRVMQLYLRELVKVLDKEDRNWRSYTCLVHDGASYATHDSFRALI